MKYTFDIKKKSIHMELSFKERFEMIRSVFTGRVSIYLPNVTIKIKKSK